METAAAKKAHVFSFVKSGTNASDSKQQSSTLKRELCAKHTVCLCHTRAIIRQGQWQKHIPKGKCTICQLMLKSETIFFNDLKNSQTFSCADKI